MATVNGYTAEHMDSLMAENIVDGSISGDNLILEKRDGTTVNAGNVRGPAGTDAAPGSVAVAADTTIVRTSDGRGKVATPTAAEDATTKAYVDGLNSARVADNASRIADDAALDARLDALENAQIVSRLGSNVRTTNTTPANAETNMCSFTIPNPINGRTYRVTFNGNLSVNASSQVRARIKHGIGAVTGGTLIAEACLDFQSTRDQSANIVVEFTYAGTTGQANYNVVATHINITGTNTVGTSNASATRPVTLIVDEII